MIIELAMKNLKGSVPPLESTNTAPLKPMTMFHTYITLPKATGKRGAIFMGSIGLEGKNELGLA